MDSDLHMMEPDGLWERYLDEPFKKFAPNFERRAGGSPNQPIIQIGPLALGEMSKRPRTAASCAPGLRGRDRGAGESDGTVDIERESRHLRPATVSSTSSWVS
jgi:hypothetical protein